MLVSDVLTPFLGGRDLTERLSISRPDCRALFICGYTNDAAVRHAVYEAEFAFLPMPYTQLVMAGKPRKVLDSKRWAVTGR